MYGELVVNSWVEIDEGCPIRFNVNSSGIVRVLCGPESTDPFEFDMHYEALREFVRLGAEALTKMEAIHANEEEARALQGG